MPKKLSIYQSFRPPPILFKTYCLKGEDIIALNKFLPIKLASGKSFNPSEQKDMQSDQGSHPWPRILSNCLITQARFSTFGSYLKLVSILSAWQERETMLRISLIKKKFTYFNWRIITILFWAFCVFFLGGVKSILLGYLPLVTKELTLSRIPVKQQYFPNFLTRGIS